MLRDSVLDFSGASAYQRLLGSGCGMLLGIVLFIASFPLLVWNEGRAVRIDRGLREGAGSVLSVSDPSQVDPANEGKLVHLTGRADTVEVLTDPEFGVSEKAIRLTRVVEMFQWIETQQEITTGRSPNGDQETATKYTYRMDWSESLIDSHQFGEEGHDNPPTMRYPGGSWTAREVRLGGYVLSPALVSQIGGAQPVPVSNELLEKVPGELRQQLQVRDASFYLPQTPRQTDRQIGDLRITYQVVRPATVSVLARQVQSSFEPYTTSNGTPVFRLVMGEQSAAAMFETLATENTVLTWVLRLVGFLLMALGIALCFQPVVAVANFIPFFGDLVGGGVLLVAAGLAFLLTLGTIAVAWMTYRPWVALPLLAVAAGGAYGLYRLGGSGRGDEALGRRRRKRRRFDRPAATPQDLPPGVIGGPPSPPRAKVLPRAGAVPASASRDEPSRPRPHDALPPSAGREGGPSSRKRRKKKAGKNRPAVPLGPLVGAGALFLVLAFGCGGLMWWVFASRGRLPTGEADVAELAKQPNLELRDVVGVYLHARNPKCRLVIGQEGDLTMEDRERIINGSGEGQYRIQGKTLAVTGGGNTYLNDTEFGDNVVLRVDGDRLIHPHIGAFVKQPSPWASPGEPEKPFAERHGTGPLGTASLLVLGAMNGEPVKATAVSADGSTVVGSTVAPGRPQRPFRWTAKSGFIDLGWPGSGLDGSGVARAVSSDGTVAAGDAYVPSWNGEAARFSALGALCLVPRKERRQTPGIHFQIAGTRLSTANAVSADGSVLAGATTTAAGLQAFRWTQPGGRVALGTLTGPNNQNQSEARGISADGAVVVGLFGDLRPAAEANRADTTRAFRWTQAGGPKELLVAPATKDFLPLAALAVSADGKVVVGVGRPGEASSPARGPFRWTEDGGAVPLGDLPDGVGNGEAEAVTADGSVVVGWSAGRGIERRAFLWEAASGMHDLQGALVRDYGLNLDGWQLQAVHGISADGRTIVGSAIKTGDLARNQADALRIWVATLNPSGKPLFAQEAEPPKVLPSKESSAPGTSCTRMACTLSFSRKIPSGTADRSASGWLTRAPSTR